MAVHSKSRRPNLEYLEDRWVPATIKLVGSNLFISNPGPTTFANPLKITATANNTFTVQDGTSSPITGLKVGSGLFITGSNNPDFIVINVGANTFGGSLLINTGNGDDTVHLQGNAGKIGGSITALTGIGADTIIFNGAGLLTVGGNVTSDLGLGFDVFLMNSGTTKIGGSLSVTNGNLVASDVPCDIGGNLSITTNEALDNVFALGINVGGSASFTSSSGNDLLRLNEGGTVGGNLTANLGAGDDAYQQGAGIGPPGTFDVFGSITVYGGAGNDTIAIGGDGATISGNATLNGGEGDNTYTLAAGMIVFGNLSIYGGNGANDLATAAIQATVAGSATFNFGNGNNLITLDTTSSVGGKVNVVTGNGDNTLTLLGAQTYWLYARFGSGNDTLVLNNAALVLTGVIDAGGGTNTFTQTAGTLSPFLTLSGF